MIHSFFFFALTSLLLTGPTLHVALRFSHNYCSDREIYFLPLLAVKWYLFGFVWKIMCRIWLALNESPEKWPETSFFCIVQILRFGSSFSIHFLCPIYLALTLGMWHVSAWFEGPLKAVRFNLPHLFFVILQGKQRHKLHTTPPPVSHLNYDHCV